MQINTNTSKRINTPVLFIGLWLLMFALYFITAQAGFVTDFTGWLDQVENQDFLTYVNRSNFEVVSLYQATQVVTWLYYQLFGASAWMWHLLFITLHTLNAVLLCKLVVNMLCDVGADHFKTGAYAGAVLFCVTPYISEVIVWEPSFHYLQGLLILLGIMLWVQQYIYTGKRKYIWYAFIVYLLSTHTLEVFYITPWLVLSLLLFYKKHAFKKGVVYFVLPMLAIFVLRLVEFKLLHGDWTSRVGTDTVMTASQGGFGKAGKYLFHLIFMGRFFNNEWRTAVYQFCDSTVGLLLVYGINIALLLWGAIRFNKLAGRLKVMVMLLLWTGASLILVVPLWFGDMMLVIFDRYAYFTCAFLFMLVALLVWAINNKYLRYAVLAVIVLVNLRYAVQVNRYWWKSSRIVNSLVENIPVEKGKALVLLNNPESMHGIPMLGAWPQSEFKLMHNLLLPEEPVDNKVHDVLAYNMLTPEDGAHVQVTGDSTLRVTLNQWGTWWWYEGIGGRSYENEDYTLNMVDGHFYDLTFKQPLEKYTLLYQVGNQWKQVNPDNQNEQW